MTEFLVCVIVVFVLLYIVGGGVLTVAGLSLLLVLISMGVFAFFVYSFALLLKSKKKNATFLKTTVNDKYKFKTAVYLVEDMECENIFPAESLLGRSLYKENKSVKVFSITDKNKVFDRMAVITTIAGLVSGAVLVAFTVFFFVGIVNF